MARRHDLRLAGRAWTRTDAPRRLRHAVEIRHESFADPAFLDLLRRHRCRPGVRPTLPAGHAFTDLTAGFAYARLHGNVDAVSEPLTATAGSPDGPRGCQRPGAAGRHHATYSSI